MTLVDSLSNIFKYRINRNEDIPGYLKKLDQMGKFDQPKTVAVITELLMRVAALEEKEVVSDAFREYPSHVTTSPEDFNTVKAIIKEQTWQEVVKKAKELGVFKPGLKRAELEALISEKSV